MVCLAYESDEYVGVVEVNGRLEMVVYRKIFFLNFRVYITFAYE